MTKAKTIRVVVAEPGKPAEVRMIPSTGEALRALVGGWLECVPIWSGHDMWLNEEGKLLGLEPNRLVAARQPGAAWDVVGTLVIAASDEEGNTIGLPQVEAERIAAALTGVTARCRPLLAHEVQEPTCWVGEWEDT